MKLYAYRCNTIPSTITWWLVESEWRCRRWPRYAIESRTPTAR